MVELLSSPTDLGRYRVAWSDTSLASLWATAFDYVSTHYPEQLETFRKVKFENLTPEHFWKEYVWTVYTSGFKVSILSKLYPKLMEAYGPWDLDRGQDSRGVDLHTYKRVIEIFGNRGKCNAILETRHRMQTLRWEQFRDGYCTSIEGLRELPFIGKVTCYHLGRNIGLDCVKPDLHLNRLAKVFGFATPLEMCESLVAYSSERIGVIDYVLWCYSATFGTTEIA